MNTKTKKTVIYSVLFMVLGGAAFYGAMEDYQKENMAKFLSQTLSISE